jgi:hypothetical protein
VRSSVANTNNHRNEGTGEVNTAVVKAEPQDQTPAGQPELKDWALVELFGHQRIVGYMSQQTFPSGVLIRVDVPDLTKDGEIIRKGFTRYFGLGAIYSITPVDEETVRSLLPSIDGTPAPRPLQLRSFNRQEEYEF